LSLDNLIDFRALPRRKPEVLTDDSAPQVQKIQTKSYLDKFVNTPQFMAQEQAKLDAERVRNQSFPSEPERDVLLFLLENAPLESWQQECLAIVRDEALYFAPQGQTKIMNEGWASYWHVKLMTEHMLCDHEVFDFADTHSGTVATPPGGFNPYKVGLELFLDIEDRWNKGQFGKDWDECDDFAVKSQWNKNLGLGLKKIFEVRKLYNDLTFIDEFFTEDFCRKNKFFTFAYNERTEQTEIASLEFAKVKAQLLRQLTNFGQPLIEITDANYQNRGELFLTHRFDGKELRPDYCEATLKNLCSLWGRPAHLLTEVQGRWIHLSFDGQNYNRKDA